MTEITIRAADPSDLISINEFLATHFHDKEPLESSHIDKVDKMVPDKEFLLDCISCGTTLVSLVDGKLVALLIAGKILPSEADRNLNCAKNINSKKAADCLMFLSYIEDKADYCRRLKVPFSLHIHAISVHPEFRGQGLAKQLFRLSMQKGKSLKFPAVSVDCTNHFTSKIAESFGMQFLSAVTYDEYNQMIGDEIFIPSKPHTVIKSYAKLFERSTSG